MRAGQSIANIAGLLALVISVYAFLAFALDLRALLVFVIGAGVLMLFSIVAYLIDKDRVRPISKPRPRATILQGLLVPFEVQPGEELVLLRRKALVVLFSKSILFLLWAVILLFARAFSKSLTGNLLTLFNQVLGPVVILSTPVMVLLWASVLLSWWSKVYVVTSRRVVIKEGLLAKSIRVAPLDKVGTVTIVANMFVRLLGLGNIRIEMAGMTGTINFDAVANADDLQQLLMEYLTSYREEMEQLQLREIMSRGIAHSPVNGP